MKIYIIVVIDHHCDPDVAIRKSREEARSFAITICKQYSVDGKYEYNNYETFESYKYSPENDEVLIFERKIEIIIGNK